MNRRVLPIIAGALVVSVLVDVPFHDSFFPGYAALVGLLGTALLVLVAKGLLAPLVDRDESYYPDDAPPDVQHDVWAVRADEVDSDGGDGPSGRHDAGGDVTGGGRHG